MGDHMFTYFQCDFCHFINMKGIDLNEGSDKEEKLVISIRRASLDALWIREPGTVRGNFNMLRNMGTMAMEELGLQDWFPPLGPYLLKKEVAMGVACVTLRISIRIGRYVGNL